MGVNGVNAVGVTILRNDTEAPLIVKSTLDLNNSKLTIEYDETVDGNTFIVTDVTITSEANSTVEYQLRTSKSCSTCEVGEFEVSSCTETEDTECATCTVCGAAQYTVSACDGANTVCADCSRGGSCGANEFQKVACQGYSDLVCETCTTCGANEYKTGECTTTSDT